ncbi:MAG: phenylalanine--tRNA ligase subunit beta [Deltaproteobacteria bacterium]|nr:phenylalanine--tRNA ligase subunit beta [Deltaproteobacteria bacterium]
MKASLRWLSRHIDLSGLTPETIANDLTLSTAEVEGIERFAPATSDVVVGHVVSRERHPDAEKLSLCRVDVGAGSGPGEALQIVCGAPNVAAGQKVAVAKIGTKLPGDLTIKRSKIRGVESFGMICSARELGVGDDHDGIWVLPENAPLGASVASALALEDFVIEIDNKSLTHRPDLWGHRGLARELAAIYERRLRPLDLAPPATGSGAAYPVAIESPACTRYVALVIDGVRAGRSPEWLRHLLLAVGQRPIDLFVDLSNFVMLDLGQPNHVFDRHRLDALGAGRGIVVRAARASAAETIRTLDGVERKTTPADLLICAGDAPVALAGIMGGDDSKVAPESEALLLEVASFRATTIRRTSSRLGLRTDSSARFEKALDPHLPLAAAGHFARLLQSIAPGVRFPAKPTDVGVWQDPTTTIELRAERVRSALGKPLPASEIRGILERLEFGVEATSVETAGETFRVRVPSFRATKDITMEQDLVEEIGRIHRYGNIAEAPLTFTIAPPARDERRRLVRHLQDRLAGGGRFRENLSYSFIADALLEKLGASDEPHVRVINPVHQGESRIRRTVAPSLLPALEANRRHHTDVRLFEIGKAYEPEASDARGEPRERHYLALAWAGSRPNPKTARWDGSRLQKLQAVVEDLVASFGLARGTWTKDGNPPRWAHPGKSLFLALPGAPHAAAVVAELEPGLAPKLGLAGDLDSEVAVAELCLDALLSAERRGSAYRPLPRYPGIKVDVAVSVPEATRAGELVALVESAGKGQVVDVELFDLYRGKSIGEGRKSLAFHVLLQSDARTLTDQDEQKFLQRFEKLVTEAGGELRKA